MMKDITEGTEVLLRALPEAVSTPDMVQLNRKYNPYNVPGVVVKVGGGRVKGLPVRVKWSNGYYNRYAFSQLEINQ
jgi:hypothetical protein